MRLLLIHPDAQSFAGAEMMLLYCLKGLDSGWCKPVVAVANRSKLAGLISDHIETICLEDSGAFNVRGLKRQLTDLARLDRVNRFDIIHGWAARDWELAALLGKWIRRPSVGTLHDHPKARFISSKRRLLMQWSARWGLDKIICVSEAVRLACLAASYPKGK